MLGSKRGRVEIHDARRVVNKKVVAAYRVKILSANNKILQVSEVLNDKKAVWRHIAAVIRVFCDVIIGEPSPVQTFDKTKKKLFLPF
jgi:hypothetical protein